MKNTALILLSGYIPVLLSTILMGISQAVAADFTAMDVMEKVTKRDEGVDRTADMKLILIDQHEQKRIRRLKVFSKKKGNDRLALMFFLHPPDVENTGFLVYDFDDPLKEDSMWLYVSALKKTKPIASHNKSHSFMGSDLNYSDMSSMTLNDYTFEFYKKQKQHRIDGSDTWAIWCIPKSKNIAEQIGYAKKLVFVRQDNFMIPRILSWVYNSDKIKFFDVKQFRKIDNIWVATRMRISVKKGSRLLHKTVVVLDNIRFNQNLDESLFTVRELEKGL